MKERVEANSEGPYIELKGVIPLSEIELNLGSPEARCACAVVEETALVRNARSGKVDEHDRIFFRILEDEWKPYIWSYK